MLLGTFWEDKRVFGAQWLSAGFYLDWEYVIF